MKVLYGVESVLVETAFKKELEICSRAGIWRSDINKIRFTRCIGVTGFKLRLRSYYVKQFVRQWRLEVIHKSSYVVEKHQTRFLMEP